MTSRRSAWLLLTFLILLGALVLTFITSGRRAPVSPLGPVILVYDVPSTVAESRPATQALSLADFRRDDPTLWEIVFNIRRAAEDSRVRGLVLHVDGIDWGWARIQELRSALDAFRASGKPVYASLRGGGEAEYLLASKADVVGLPATATLQVDGLTASALFLRGTYDKLDIRPNFEHVGAFKSGVEPYTRTGMSPESRLALEALLDDQYGMFVDSVAVARIMERDSVLRLVDRGPFGGDDARREGLVDTLLEQAELDSLAVLRAGRGTRAIRFDRYMRGVDATQETAPLALVVAAGDIMPGRSQSSPWSGDRLGAETLIAQLRELRERGSVRAVVLRIDSPGGDGGASDDVWREVRRLRAVKPVIVSMSDVAASGGYYIACAADSIVAQPGTLTGSIGVFGGKLNLLGLYQKVGLNVETVTRGRHAEMMSPFRDFTPEEAARFRERLADFYATFLARVAAGRDIEPAQVDSVGQGRVWSGVAANDRGLVDALGGMEAALRMAARRAGLEESEWSTVRLVPHGRGNAFGQFLARLVEDDQEQEIRAWLARPELRLLERARRFPSGTILARLPFELEYD